MKRISFVFLCLFLIFSCTDNKENALPNTSVFKAEGNKSYSSYLTFSYSLERPERPKLAKGQVYGNNLIYANCKLYNSGIDTFYFFTYSCAGWIHNFLIDTSKIELLINFDCNVSSPIIKKIAPKSSFEFKASFDLKDPNYNNIDLSYSICPVSSNFNVYDQEAIKNLKPVILKRDQEKAFPIDFSEKESSGEVVIPSVKK
jgi:hypothetical protein